jgi:putative hydrolase of the HAD superfamily
LIAKQHTTARRCILVEDTIDTLKAAKALGMRTAWITQYLATNPNLQRKSGQLVLPNTTKRPVYVDVKVKSVRQLPDRLHRLR